MRIMIADDDQDIRDLLRILLRSNQYETVEVENGEEAVALCGQGIDLFLLDVMMPVMDGYQACAEIRKRSKAPVIFLTAKGQEYDKLEGLSIGGDDYIVKPFKPLELLARVHAQLRRWIEYGADRSATGDGSLIQCGSLVIDEDTCIVKVDEVPRDLTATEFKMLHLMASTRGKVFSAKNLYESIWEEPYFHSANNTVMVHIRRLREKNETDPKNPRHIKTVWGMGYKVE